MTQPLVIKELTYGILRKADACKHIESQFGSVTVEAHGRPRARV